MLIIKDDYSNQLELQIKGLGYILHPDGRGRLVLFSQENEQLDYNVV